MNNIIIGETCLLDKQLRYHKIINNPHGCFDNILVNLDGIDAIIDDDFHQILSPNELKHIVYPYYPDHNICHEKWVNLKYSINTDNIYSWEVMAFFHLDSPDDWETLKRRIERTKSWFEDESPIILYYYYRRNKNYNIYMHEDKMVKFVNKISKKYDKKVKCINIMNELGDSNIVERQIDDNILSYTISSKHSWIDIDDNWDAHTDYDLFYKLFTSEKYNKFLKYV